MIADTNKRKSRFFIDDQQNPLIFTKIKTIDKILSLLKTLNVDQWK